MTPSPTQVANLYLASNPKFTVQDENLGTVSVDDLYIDGDSAKYYVLGTIRAPGVLEKFECYLTGWDSDPRRNRIAVRDFRLRKPDSDTEEALRSAFIKLVAAQGMALGNYIYSRIGE